MLMTFILIAIAGIVLGNFLRAPALFAVSILGAFLFLAVSLALGWPVTDILLYGFGFLATLQFGYLAGLFLAAYLSQLKAWSLVQKIKNLLTAARHAHPNK